MTDKSGCKVPQGEGRIRRCCYQPNGNWQVPGAKATRVQDHKMRWSPKSETRPTVLIVAIIAGLLSCLSTFNNLLAYHNATYTEAAHGDTSSGVNRASIAAHGYSRGNCAHCHEQHGSIGGAEPDPVNGNPSQFLLARATNPTSQTDTICVACHYGGNVLNYDYGNTFAGGTANSNNIKAALNYGPPNQSANGATGSSHSISYVRDWTGNKGFGSWMTADTIGCLACHDVHRAQKNYPVQSHPQGGVKTAIRRPNDVTSNPRNQWGDDNITFNETMAAFTSKYQAPVYFPWANGKTQYEPANNSTSDGSNLPNYKNFCLSCHASSINSNKSDSYFNPDKDLGSIDYGGDQHGAADDSNTNLEGSLIYPYTNVSTNYRLSCCDCHEPHGSPNPFLLRTCVNGTDGITVSISSTGTDWDDLNFYAFCSACHTVNVGSGSGSHTMMNNTNKTTYNCMFNGGCHAHHPRSSGF